MYQFKEGVNQSQFFWWDRELIENMNWALLPKSSKAVFPVIACHCDKKGKAFPGEQTIAILAGITDKTAREGIQKLEMFPGFTWENYVSKRGKRAKRFKLHLPDSSNNGRAFPFHRFILEGGMWRVIKPSAQALYPVMRYFSYFDINEYEDENGEQFTEQDFNWVYPTRDYEFCEADLVIMTEYAGLHRNSINTALMDLESHLLIEPLNGKWKVFLRPRKHYKRDFLNKEIMRSYAHIL